MKWSWPTSVRDSVANVFAHHWAETLYLQRKAFARDNCIEDQNNVNQFPPSNTRISTGLGMVGAAALAFGAAGGGAMIASYLGGGESSPPVQPTAAQVELYYKDPEVGLVPIAGAATDRGGTITTPSAGDDE